MSPVSADYRSALDAARADLTAAYRELETAQRRVAQLRQAVKTLGALCEEETPQEIYKATIRKSGTLTDAVSTAIVASDEPLSATEVRRVLDDMGFRFQTTNRLASIHSVIKRLLKKGHIRAVRKLVTDELAGPELKFCFGKPPADWVLAENTTFDAKARGWRVNESEWANRDEPF